MHHPCVLLVHDRCDVKYAVVYLQEDVSAPEHVAICHGSSQFITHFIWRINCQAGLGYKLIHTQHRDAAVIPADSAFLSLVSGKRPNWSLVIQGRHIAYGVDKVMIDGFLHV